MRHSYITRRQFLTTTTAAAALALAPRSLGEPFHSTIHKAIIVGKIGEKEMTALKNAGFEGVETTHICPEEEAAAGAALAKSFGLRVHSVLRGWAKFSSNDPKEIEDGLEKSRAALRAAKAYGADTILLVPDVVNGIPMPQPWEFKVEFDAKTVHVSRVADGDNSKYAEYINAQNRATDMSRIAVEKLIPLAEETDIIIGLENVWNNLWVDPKLYKHFVASFQSKWVQAYFDIGNVVKYSPPQDWIHELGSLIVKLHVKDYRLTDNGHKGGFVHPRDGSINWPAVRKALDDVNYNGWASIEDWGLPFKEFDRRFDLIVAGK